MHTCISVLKSQIMGADECPYIYFSLKKQLPTVASYNKSCNIVNSGEEWISNKLFRTELYDNVKKRLRHVRTGVAMAELCRRTSHMTYQCSPECNQT